ncbi:Protein of unknown function (DUF2953) [Acididesulfobacillus acetoxydans]|uniref:DUF2953 domain-containing protein n=1 Tax=Acididesulfobacillus acetoxydans TaxID=1561005 RepID=A0A8S0WFT3_9FIRM|nr:DUF2953 domain-containing protein [Acididesulfobacillus acetoxydans]CAA7601332.1 Protein of unknown function (DUF2953) [Acididesulfobacillus acetoxydans]CEJ09364.1 Protein of unknown function (DUF2953) [Acididesulfobacillus acetoxydans]
MLLSIVGYVLLIIGLVLLAIVFIPYSYHVSGEYFDEAEIEGSLSWLFGGVRIDFYKGSDANIALDVTLCGLTKKTKRGPGSPGAKSEKKTEARKKGKTVRSKQLAGLARYFDRDVIQKAVSAIVKLLKHCRPKIVSVRARIGFADPMYTGLLYALKSQIYLLWHRYDIDIQPVFDEEIIEGRFLIGGGIWLPYLILVVIGFLFTQPIRNIFISNFRRKIKGGSLYVR